MKFHIQDRVQIGRYEHLGSLQGATGVIVSLAKPAEGFGSYQLCNIQRDGVDGKPGERLPNIDSRVLKKVEAK
jgi:hypothetical protein